MRARTLTVVIVVLLVAVFVAVNGAAFLAPTRLDLLVANVEAPLGVVMLCLLVLAVLASAAYMAVWRGTVLVESRRQARELEAQRVLAENAEASRITELRQALHDDVERLAARIAALDEALRAEIRDNANALAATLAEMDDRWGGAGPAPAR